MIYKANIRKPLIGPCAGQYQELSVIVSARSDKDVARAVNKLPHYTDAILVSFGKAPEYLWEVRAGDGNMGCYHVADVMAPTPELAIKRAGLKKPRGCDVDGDDVSLTYSTYSPRLQYCPIVITATIKN